MERTNAGRPRPRRPTLPIFILALASITSVSAAELVASRAHAPRSGPPGATRFTELPAAATGLAVTNRYDDPRMWREHYREFLLGAIGTGVAIADYDGDQRPDILVVSKTEGHRLFRNLGDWRFEDVTASAGVVAPDDSAWEQGATWADIDNDGDLDLYICRYAAPNLLYLNHGDGTFHEAASAAGLAISDASAMAAFADYDRDGWLDVYLLTNVLDFDHDREGRPDLLFRNNGDGTFANVTAAAGIAGPGQGHAAQWWDYNDDGWLDLYVTNDFVPPDMLYRNAGNGTFTVTLSLAVPHTPNSSMGADVGDLNQDGRLDLLVADMAPTTHEKDQRGMVAGRAEAVDRPDDPRIARQVSRSALFLNTGTEQCLEAAQLAGLAATDWTWSVRCADFDLDGREDVFVTTGMVRELHNTDLNAAINRAETPQERIRLMQESPVFAESNLAFRNLGDLRFARVERDWGLDHTGVSFGAATGDLDGDGDLDLVFTNYQAGITVLRNDSSEGHAVTVALRGTASNRFGVGAIVRLATSEGEQVRQLMLARGYLSCSEPALHFGLGATERIKHITVMWPSGRTQRIDDLAADRMYTITESPDATSSAAERPESPGTDTSTFREVGAQFNLAFTMREDVLDETAAQPLLPRRFNRGGPALAVGDLNGDDRDDVCLGGTTRDPARMLLAHPSSGPFQAVESLLPFGQAGVNDGPILIFDANGDGANDVLLTAGGVARPAGAPDYQPRLLLNRGGGWFAADAEALPPLPISVGAAAVADFDRDGRLDVFLGGRVVPGAYPLPPRSALLVNRGGKFEDATSAVAPELAVVGLVTSALWSDVDGDGWLDLMVALEWGGIRFFRNQDGRHLVDASEEAGFATAGIGWWTSLAAADFNGDGRLDYVAGNVGLNTPYPASPEAPALLFHGTFEESANAQPRLLEAYYENGRLLPRRGRLQLGAAIPAVARRFVNSNAYARATLAEIVGAEQLAAARRFVATNLASGVFLSRADGTYRFTVLPRIAQIAPLQGIAAGDFDGDGDADIYALQNSHAPIPSVGRFDGGLSQLLLGDGAGNFLPAPVASCGLIVPGDARALVVLDLDRNGWPDFLASRNRDRSLAWLNPGAPGRAMWRLELRGNAGNPQAIGAFVTVELADGSRQVAEVRAGGGVFSQSTAALFFGGPVPTPARRVVVRWPSGAVTTEELAAPINELILEAPPS